MTKVPYWEVEVWEKKGYRKVPRQKIDWPRRMESERRHEDEYLLMRRGIVEKWFKEKEEGAKLIFCS